MGERDEGLAAVAAVLADVAADLVVATPVAMLVAQPAEELHGGGALLWRGGLGLRGGGGGDGGGGAPDGGGPGVGAGGRGGGGLAAGVGLGLGVGEALPDLAAGVAEGAGDLPNAHAVAAREADLGVVVHRQHPCLRSSGPRGDGAYWNGCGWGGSILLADPEAGGGSLLRADYQGP